MLDDLRRRFQKKPKEAPKPSAGAQEAGQEHEPAPKAEAPAPKRRELPAGRALNPRLALAGGALAGLALVYLFLRIFLSPPPPAPYPEPAAPPASAVTTGPVPPVPTPSAPSPVQPGGAPSQPAPSPAPAPGGQAGTAKGISAGASPEGEATQAPASPPVERDPFGNPTLTPRPAQTSPGAASPKAELPALPPPPAALPPPPSPKAEPPKKAPPANPSREAGVRCLGVSLARQASAVLLVRGVQVSLSVGEEIPGIGKLVSVSANGCEVRVEGKNVKLPLGMEVQ